MSLFPGMRDIGLSLDGDLMFDDNGDVATVSGDDWVVHEINKRIRTSNPGWVLHPSVGAGIEDFVGRPSTKSLGLQIEHAVRRSLTVDGFLLPGAIVVQAVPTSLTSISVFVTVTAPGGQSVVTNAIFDVRNGIVRKMDKTASIIQTPTGARHQDTTNKYALRRR